MITHEEPASLWRRLRGPTEEQLWATWDELAARGQRLQVSYNRRLWVARLVGALGVSGVFLAAAVAGAGMVTLVAGLIPVPFVLSAARRLRAGGPAVVVDQRGVYVDRLGALVPWSEIHGAGTRSATEGMSFAYLQVTTDWVKEQTSDLAPIRAFGLVLAVRNEHARLNLPRGLEYPPHALSLWISKRPYAPQAQHLAAMLRVDKMTFAPLVDPSRDEVFDLVLRVAEGKRASLVLVHTASEPRDVWLELAHDKDHPLTMTEYLGDDEATSGRVIPDIATAAEQVTQWVRDKDAEMS